MDPNYITATEDGWYEISTPQQLLWWAYYAAKKNLGAKGRLTDDIDMQGIDNYPIVGREGNPFYGSFDGQFHVISNLVINHPSLPMPSTRMPTARRTLSSSATSLWMRAAR